jgi:acetyltransferase-like isoleucine patch superfamily enzyme
VLIAKDCSIVDSDHSHAGPADNVLFNPVERSPIRIGRGTWLGDRVSVLRGADIGRHCTIGAGSVVRGRIPDYSVAVGAPARVVGSTR